MHYADDQAEIHRLVVGPLDNNVFVLRCKQTGDAVMIDAANEHDKLLELCRSLGVTKVVETHGHWDHIQAVPQVREAGYEVGVTAADSAMLPSYDFVLEDETVLNVGRLKLQTIATPGHTPGSMCFHVQGSPVLFSGDTLFPGGPGATKFPGGDFPTIITSIGEKIFSRFPADTIVMPGHGADTTVGAESPHLQEWVDRGW
ncbi:MAG TPA: MBL fold metallo-hydrolase [Acidimicrobiales bacterium]|jgi:glyoxylase-like metal-dependent hydrolase (beta-lactamase superfamily II)|nr:MBL fold metallo-hydrolase [Acidimicrobiales bacterium]